MTAMCVAAADT